MGKAMSLSLSPSVCLLGSTMFAVCGLDPHHSPSQVCSFTALTPLRTRLQALCLSQGSVQIPSQWVFLDSTQAGTLFFA